MNAGFPFGSVQSLKQSDFDEYKGRLGERSPTPFDAFRFAQLESAIVNSLSPSDMSNYVNAIWVWKGKEPGDKTRAAAIIRELEAKAVGPPQSKKNYRVMLLQSGRKGMVPADYVDGFGTSEDSKIQIKFDDKPEAIEEYSMEDVAFLCEVCDNAPGKRCTRCKRAYYCSTSCQRSAWNEHRKICVRIDIGQ
jgi:hypothetical protein